MPRSHSCPLDLRVSLQSCCHGSTSEGGTDLPQASQMVGREAREVAVKLRVTRITRVPVSRGW